MMHKSHALSGVLFVTSVGAVAHPTPSTLVLAATAIPGFALLNDIDHARSLVSSTYGPLTRVWSLFLAHRRETHSYPGIAALGLVTELAVWFSDTIVARVWLTALLVLCWASILRTLRVKGLLADLLPFAIAIPVVWYRAEAVASGLPEYPLEFIPVALVCGMLVHVWGDCLTNSGCPLWWPFSKKRTAFKLRVFGRKLAINTGKRFELRVIYPAMWLGVAGTLLLWAADRT